MKFYYAFAFCLFSLNMAQAQIDLHATGIQYTLPDGLSAGSKYNDINGLYTFVNKDVATTYQDNLYLSSDSVFNKESDILIKTVIDSMDLISIADAEYWMYNLLIPTDLKWTTNKVYLIFEVDANNVIAEIKENNNVAISKSIPFHNIITGISDFDLNEVKISPVPFTDRLSISNIGEAELEFLSAEGKVVLQLNSENDIDLNVNSFLPGIYYLKIKKGTEVQVRKIVKY